MKKFILFFIICIVSLSAFTQERLLTKKIVYQIELTDNVVHSSAQKDSIQYNYIVNKRLFWEAMDKLMNDLKTKKLYLQTFNGDTIIWDSMINNLTKQLNIQDLKKYSKKEIEKVLEDEIRAIKFMEQWTYEPQTMMINKTITAFCPVIQRDSVALIDEDLKSVKAFEFEIGWIKQNNASISNDTLLICRNLQYTTPIYNKKPYHWWDNNLEAEYSLPFFDLLMSQVAKRIILCYNDPNSTEPFSLSELEKRKKYSVTTSIYLDTPENATIEKDSTIFFTYNSDDIDHLRFGEEIYYDKKNNNFIKNVNYYAPIISIYRDNNLFIGFYPLYYVRKP